MRGISSSQAAYLSRPCLAAFVCTGSHSLRCSSSPLAVRIPYLQKTNRAALTGNSVSWRRVRDFIASLRSLRLGKRSTGAFGFGFASTFLAVRIPYLQKQTEPPLRATLFLGGELGILSPRFARCDSANAPPERLVSASPQLSSLFESLIYKNKQSRPYGQLCFLAES